MSYCPVGCELTGVRLRNSLVRHRKPRLLSLNGEMMPGSLSAPTGVEFVQDTVEVLIVDGAAITLARHMLEQMRKLVATGVRQQIQRGNCPSEILSLADLPPGQPATNRIGLVLVHNHAFTVGDLVLLQVWIKTMVGGLARTDTA